MKESTLHRSATVGELEEIGRSEFGPGKTGRRTPELNLGEVIEVGGDEKKEGKIKKMIIKNG